MSKPLDTLPRHLETSEPTNIQDVLSLLVSSLNLAIDRINELEAKYEGHEHDHLAVTSDTEALVTPNPKENE